MRLSSKSCWHHHCLHKPGSEPGLSMRWTRKLGPLRLVVERTTCVVRASTTRDVLINAANESLAGAQLPYFPRGGPCPPPLPEGLGNNANSWGALETGPGFVFREQAVDGVVTSLGGKALRDLCARARPHGFGAGSAVATAAPGLPFETVVHAVAPFWESPSWRADLLRAYQKAFALAAARDVATPLLGAGARGAPVADAAAAAAEAVAAAASASRPPKSVSFGVADDEAFDALVRNCGLYYYRTRTVFTPEGERDVGLRFSRRSQRIGGGRGFFEASGCPRQRAKFGGGDRCA